MVSEVCEMCESRFNLRPKSRCLGKIIICGKCRNETPPSIFRCVSKNNRNNRCKNWRMPNELSCSYHGR
jgi:hypothetical protein